MNAIGSYLNFLRPVTDQSRPLDYTFPSIDALAFGLSTAIGHSSSTPLPIILTSDFAQAQQMTHLLSSYLPHHAVTLLPDWDTLPYETNLLSDSLPGQRLQWMSELLAHQPKCYVLAVPSMLQQIPPNSFIATAQFELRVGQPIDLKNFKEVLVAAGYQRVEQVLLPGDFSIHGDACDVFLFSTPEPYRISLLDVAVESIHRFNPETSALTDTQQVLRVHSKQEFPTHSLGIDIFFKKLAQQFSQPLRAPFFKALRKNILQPGIQYWQPLFFQDNMQTIFDLLPSDRPLIGIGSLLDAAKKMHARIEHRYKELNVLTAPLLPPEMLWMTPSQFGQQLKKRLNAAIHLDEKPQKNTPLHGLSQLDETLYQRFWQFPKTTTPQIILAETTGQAIHLQARFQQQGMSLKFLTDCSIPTLGTWQEPYGLYLAPAREGFCYHHPTNQRMYQFIPAIRILQTHMVPSSRAQLSKLSRDVALKEKKLSRATMQLDQLQLQDPVVHLQHGVGRYEGLVTLEINQTQSEFLVLRYAQGAKLYLPVHALHAIMPYSGRTETAPLHKLGGEQWQKQKAQAEKAAADTAAQWLETQAKRHLVVGESYKVEDPSYDVFCSRFPHELTPDQASAIAAVEKDLQSSTPMDRLVCGEVGFGKTEVALRAAFITAILNHKQVIVLVPTTLLAHQHTKRFTERFAETNLLIGTLTRFTNSSKENALKELFQQKTPGILIGTHKILPFARSLKNLGLLIIDEEHRFGVRQKLHIQYWKAQINLLSLTATPIPRTLNIALSGLKDISLIATPPPHRQGVKTLLLPHKSALIADAILREIRRGGQVYYLHNDVRSIYACANQLKALVPEARIIVGHGQMPEGELESLMLQFEQQEAQVLVCTTIIETGIDIPNVNTVIIAKAAQFGMAQLHQIRGRVGRRAQQAYAYLLFDPDQRLSKPAQLRLQALCQFQSLGSGFNIATQDLDLRGAGTLLGEAQSGQIQEVGWSCYLRLLEEAIELQKGSPTGVLRPVDIELGLACALPELAIPEVTRRLYWYQQITSTESIEDLNAVALALADELKVPFPIKTRNLFWLQELRCLAQACGIHSLKAIRQGILLQFHRPIEIPIDKLLEFIQKHSEQCQLLPSEALLLHARSELSQEERMVQLKALLAQLAKLRNAL